MDTYHGQYGLSIVQRELEVSNNTRERVNHNTSLHHHCAISQSVWCINEDG